ncbi:hypothetical protein OESDEN_24628 [Oesophagostomum dentatum]|uniref:Uncharacterized protein n=1 Tax=Oesophagostomum dentatum TaxID=61180 RepID=A0A0B1RVT5_OESDE|nr:hypothetical protein OESDEN_24628 [Oesophagostomum dentatum]
MLCKSHRLLFRLDTLRPSCIIWCLKKNLRGSKVTSVRSTQWLGTQQEISLPPVEKMVTFEYKNSMTIISSSNTTTDENCFVVDINFCFVGRVVIPKSNWIVFVGVFPFLSVTAASVKFHC